MENQINMGDQTTQQLGQNPVNQPVQIPGKPKVNYWMYVTIALVIVILFGGIYTLSLKKQLNFSYNPISKQNNQQGPSVVPVTTLFPTASPPVTNPTSEWTTYESIQGYEIKYPNS